MSKKSTDPFEELVNKKRTITPKKLTGEQLDMWRKFVAKYKKGTYAGLSMAALFSWAKTHLGLSCSISRFRQELLAAAK